MKCKVSHKRSTRRRSVSRKRSVKRRRSVSRKRSVSRRRRSSVRRINRARTTSVCGQHLKRDCPSPQCTWARNIGCRKSVGYPVGTVPTVPSVSILSAEETAAAAAVARARAASGFNVESFLKDTKGCHSYADKDACPKQSDGMCKWEDSVNKCLPNLEANWGSQMDETKDRYDALMKYYKSAAPAAAPVAIGQDVTLSEALGMPF